MSYEELTQTQNDAKEPSRRLPDPARAHVPAPSPASVLLRRSWIVVIGAIVIAAAVYAISKRVPATYGSSAQVAVVVSGTDVNDTSLGANNLAGQYAQEVSATPVLAYADRLLGRHSAGIPASAITGGAVGAQNLISIQATAGSPGVAQRRAAAVTTAFTNYVAQQVQAQAAGYQTASSRQLKPINTQIAQTEAQLNAVGSATSANAVALSSELSSLVAQRAVSEGNIAQTAENGRPSISLVSNAAAGSETAPKPKLYALIGFVLGLLILARLVVYFGTRRAVR